MLILGTSKVKRMPHQISPANLVSYWPLDDLAEGTNINTQTFLDRVSVNNGTGVDSDADSDAIAEEVLSYP